MRVRLSIVFLGLSTFLTSPNIALAIDQKDYPALRPFVQRMVNTYGFAEDELNQWFQQTEVSQTVISAITAPKEALPWYEYRKLFVTQPSARRGKQFWQKHAAALVRAQRKFGVDPATIVAIIGVETQYGRNTGGFRVMDALTTLTLEYPPRSDFFRRELQEYLLLTRELRLNPLALRGSYAGAIGVPQFIPSSYREYAIDFDADQQRDLINSVADAIGSVANFLKRHGWQENGVVVERLELDHELLAWLEKVQSSPMPPLRYLLGYGVLPMEYNDVADSAALIRFEGEQGPVYYLGHNNFGVITRYNRSQNYAMAVHELSEWVRRLYQQAR
ncbi:MAG: lytic murein transglycosylase B [Acidiferrobacterales bacterium]